VRLLLITLVLCAGALPVLAQEPVGCDKFKWPLEKERATLTGTDMPKVASGSRIGWPLPLATLVTLVPLADAKLPMPPERTPKASDNFAGFIQAPAPAKAATYKITLSSAGWIDVVQDGRRVPSITSTGVTGCAGVRKSVTFDLAATPFTVQLSGIESDIVGVVISGE
jgi:hypothetical protein